jgi:hypothetical protein
VSLSQKDKLGVALIVIAVLVMVGVVAGTAVLQRSTSAVKVDAETLCPFSQNYAHTVVLVDKTDPFSASQKKKFYAKIMQIRQELQPLEKLSIYVLDDRNYLAPRPAFAVCNPGSGRAANPLYQNPRMWEKRFQQKFGKPLDSVVEVLSEGTSKNTSPILEMIHAVSQVFDFGPKAGRRRLILFSDLMHNVPEYSHFNGIWEYEKFRTSPYAAKLQTNLADARIEIIYLLRPELYKYQSQPKHQNFWGSWFEGNGAKEVSLERAP